LIKKAQHLKKFKASKLPKSVTDVSLDGLKHAKMLEELNISFCKQVTDKTIEALVNINCRLKEL